MRKHASNYLGHTLELMRMTWEEFAHLFMTVGQVYGIYEDHRLAGFYWIEERGNVLHLHALVLKEEFQGKGIGTRVLKMLEKKYKNDVKYIELGVHISNERARALYEGLGYEIVKTIDDLGFHIMKKHLSNEHGTL